MKIELRSNEPIGVIKVRLLVIFVVAYITINLACDILAHRYVSLVGLTLLGASFYYPLTYAICDIVAELFGYCTARQLIWLGLIADVLFALMIVGANHLPVPSFWQQQSSFDIVLNPLLRLSFGCVIGGLVGRFFSIYILSKSKLMFAGRFFWLRCIFAMSLGMSVHSLLSDFIIFYQVIPTHHLIEILRNNYLTNILFTMLYFSLPITVVTWVKRKYGIDGDDYGVNYNPFALK